LWFTANVIELLNYAKRGMEKEKKNTNKKAPLSGAS